MQSNVRVNDGPLYAELGHAHGSSTSTVEVYVTAGESERFTVDRLVEALRFALYSAGFDEALEHVRAGRQFRVTIHPDRPRSIGKGREVHTTRGTR